MAEQPREVDVAIVGGGLGGLALAVGLVHRGYNAHLFEGAPELRTATSTLLALAGNAFKALELLHPDTVPQIKAAGALRQLSVQHIRVSPDQPVQEKRTPADLNTDHWYTVRWSEVQRVLSELLPADRVHCSHKATGYTEHADKGYAAVHFKGQPDVHARLVVGADGVRSAIRGTMIPKDPGIRYLGQISWNALLHNPGGSVVDEHGPGEIHSWSNSPTGSWIGAGPDWGHIKFSFIIDAGGGYTFLHFSIVSETPAFTGQSKADDNNGDAASTASTTGSGGEARSNYVVWGGLARPGCKERVLQLMREAGFDGPAKVLERIPESDLYERAAIDRVPLDEVYGSMCSPGKRVLLLGDAAHAMHGGPGQGARTAFEDAHTLVAALEQRRAQLHGWTITPSSLPPLANGSSGSPADQAASGVSELQLDEQARRPADEAAVRGAAAEYDHLRLARTCRIQRFAAEGCGLKAIREQYAPKGLTPEERLPRVMEFSKWAAQYPDNPHGDPASKYWQPVA